MKKRTRIIVALVALAAASSYGFVRVYCSGQPAVDPNYCCGPDPALPTNIPAIVKPASPVRN